MEEQTGKTGAVLKINSLRSDGSSNDGTVDVPLRDPQGQVILGEDGETPAIVFTGVPLPYNEWQRRLKKQYTHKVPNPNGRGSGMIEQVDSDKAVLDLLVERIEGWRGVVAADGQAIPCNEHTRPVVFAHLDTFTRVKIAAGLTGAEVSDLSEFRA